MTKMDDTQLQAELRRWRSAKAKSEGIAQVFRVIQNAVIDGLVGLRPTTKLQLLQVKGLGPTRANKYGDELLEIIRKASGVTKAADEAEIENRDIPERGSNSTKPWTASERSDLQKMHKEGVTLKVMAAMLGRTELRVMYELKHLGLNPQQTSAKAHAIEAKGHNGTEENAPTSDTAAPPTPAKASAR